LAAELGLSLQQGALVLHFCPCTGVGRSRFLHHDRLSPPRKRDIEGNKVRLVLRYILFREYRIHRTFGHADRAIDAGVWIDGQEIRAFAKRVGREKLLAIGVSMTCCGRSFPK